MNTLTYHNDAEFKREFVRETVWHRKQNAYVKGTYDLKAVEFRGCSVGCSVNSMKRLGRNGMAHCDHSALAAALGWPEWLVRLQDTIFEGLPQAEAIRWTERLAKAVPVGANLDVAKWRFLVFVMNHNLRVVNRLKLDTALKATISTAISGTREVYLAALHDGSVDTAAADAAWSAAEAAWSAADAARSAADAAYVGFARHLIRFIKATP